MRALHVFHLAHARDVRARWQHRHRGSHCRRRLCLDRDEQRLVDNRDRWRERKRQRNGPYSVAAYTGRPKNRNGTITIAGQTFSVKQSK